jgi:hypothetical protein
MDIGKNLGRTYGAVRKQLQILGTRARDAEGYLSAAQLSKEFNCSCHRLRTLLNDGAIKGAVYDKTRNRWKIDPIFINAETEAKLRAPRRTHKTHPLDVGDYYQRYGIVRHKALELPYLEPEKRN